MALGNLVVSQEQRRKVNPQVKVMEAMYLMEPEEINNMYDVLTTMQEKMKWKKTCRQLVEFWEILKIWLQTWAQKSRNKTHSSIVLMIRVETLVYESILQIREQKPYSKNNGLRINQYFWKTSVKISSHIIPNEKTIT